MDHLKRRRARAREAAKDYSIGAPPTKGFLMSQAEDRRVSARLMETYGIHLSLLVSDYTRIAISPNTGLTDKERKYLKKRVDTLGQALDEIRVVRERLQHGSHLKSIKQGAKRVVEAKHGR